MENQKTAGGNPLGYEKITVLLKRFAIPSIIAMVVSSLYNIVDQIFIGQGVGYLGNAATNVSYPITTICLAAALLVGVGGSAKFSLELGAGNEKEATHCVGNMFWSALALSLIIAAVVQIFLTPLLHAFGATENILPYAQSYVRITGIGIPFLILTNVLSNIIRADGSPNYSMACMVVGAIINTILDPIFIFVFDMGVAGAALATTISQLISFVVSFAYLFRFKSIKLGKDFFKPSLKKSIELASLGISNSFNQLALTLLQVVLNNSLSYYGAMTVYGSDIPLSGAGIAIKVNSIITGIFVGLAQGSQPILGYNYGAGQNQRVKNTYKLEVKCSFIVSTIAFITFQFFPKYIIGLFGSGNDLYMEFTIKFMRIFLMMILINSVQMLSASFFSAIGKPLKGTLLSLSRQILILIPLILIFPLFWGLDGILYSAPVADIFAFFISIFMIKKEFAKMN